MADSLYSLLDELERGGSEPRTSRNHHYPSVAKAPVLQQYRLPIDTGRGHQPRDRYRLVHDVVEDDGDQYEYGYEGGRQMAMGFEEFDQRLLSTPYDDRQRQAEEGRARLSFAPREGERSHFSSRPLGSERYPEQSIRAALSQFAYNRRQNQDASSDSPIVESSSPAFEAGRRKGHFNPTHRAPPLRQYEAERRVATPEQRLQAVHAYHSTAPSRELRGPTSLPHVGPTVQGIPLVPVSILPDRIRPVFPFPTFNAIQSKCFENVFRTDNNFVLASPTGSGKTAVLELAICRAVAANVNDQYKFVYQAPTKALCSERHRDWQQKFNQIGLNCVELTGDSDATDLRNVQSANIIVTTPEKWDSITRKWKDHEKLMKLIKLFLIDEVHILKEDRGAVLEAVVSRMKSIGTDVRFVALSATVPNYGDVAKWLGRNSKDQHTPANSEKFGEDFRPVKLRKHVCGYSSTASNDFVFEKVLDGKLPEVVQRYSERKPIMVFCPTRTSTVSTAKLLAKWWTSRPGSERLWLPPSNRIPMRNQDLRECVLAGVAFHHAGLELDDRKEVEKGFLNGDIGVICCTSTLSMGVNLPCHLVIVKNTVSYTNSGLQEYTDLEVMQMLGRAGRPQFDDSAVAVIMTRQGKASRYETMVTGQDVLESKFHLNLIDHINAEISLGTIRDLVSARKWLSGTFLYVRLQQNSRHYTLQGTKGSQSIEEQLDDICARDITLLQEYNLVIDQRALRSTEFGHAMARYYVHFETMKIFMGLQQKASLSEILSALAQASEFSTIRFRAGEKSLYKGINKSPSIRFSIPVNLDLPAHKVSLLIQSVLGCVDIPWNGENQRHKGQYNLDVSTLFKCINSLIRCIIDCQISLGDSISISHALTMERSLGARVWDDSPLQLKQVEGIGVVAVRKLVNAGIRSMEDLEFTDAHRIETLVGRNPPFGLKVLEKLMSFPKLRVSLHISPTSTKKCPDGVQVQVKADIGFINETVPQNFEHKPVYVCFLAENSDGEKIHFARISGVRLGKGQRLDFPTVLTNPNQSINCYLMCDSIAGTMRSATLKPKIALSMFPTPKSLEVATVDQSDRPVSNMSRRRTESTEMTRKFVVESEEFDDDGIDDNELLNISHNDQEFEDIDAYSKPEENLNRHRQSKKASAMGKRSVMTAFRAEDPDDDTRQLANGKWACNHRCKDKDACKHMCCRDGLDRPPKKTTAKHVHSQENLSQAMSKKPGQKVAPMQTKLQLSPSKRKIPAAVEELDLTQTQQNKKAKYSQSSSSAEWTVPHHNYKNSKKTKPDTLRTSIANQRPTYSYAKGGEHKLSFMQEYNSAKTPNTSSDYEDVHFDELLSKFGYSEQDNHHHQHKETEDEHLTAGEVTASDGCIHGDDSAFGEAMVGLADSEALHNERASPMTGAQEFAPKTNINHNKYRQEESGQGTLNTVDEFEDVLFSTQTFHDLPNQTFVEPPEKSTMSGNQQTQGGFESTKLLVDDSVLKEAEEVKIKLHGSHLGTTRDCTHTQLESAGDISVPSSRALGHPSTKEEDTPENFKDLEPWLFSEFGDIVELVD